MIASGSNVANSDRHIGREFPLDIDRILLHSRCLSILIHVADRCANPAQGAFAVAGWTDDATWERVIERDRWVWRALRNYSVLCIADLPVVVVGCAGNRIIVRRPKHPITAADDGSRIQRIGHTGARRPFQRRRVALIGPVTANTGIHQAPADLPRCRTCGGIGGNGQVTQAATCFRIKTH